MAMSNNSLAVDAAEAAGQAVEKTCAFCSAPASKRCSQCHQAYYCSKDHQREDWSIHRQTCNNSPIQAAEAKPNVMWLALDDTHEITKDWTTEFRKMVESQATIKRAFHESVALQLLQSTQFAAVVVMGALQPREYPTLARALVSYATNQAGVVLFGWAYPTFTPFGEFENLFALFGKNWKAGDYYREVFVRNGPSGNLDDQPTSTLLDELQYRGGNALPESYSMKALQARGVTREGAVYIARESRHSTPTGEELQAPIAFTKVGTGWLGYLGDVNGEKSTTLVAMSMIGLRAT